jgi:arylsulfatase
VTSNTYYDWFLSQPYIIFAAQTGVARFLATFTEFPPRQRAATFGVDQAVEKMKQNLGSQ